MTSSNSVTGSKFVALVAAEGGEAEIHSVGTVMYRGFELRPAAGEAP